MKASVSLTRPRSLWPMAFWLWVQPLTAITPEHMHVARAMTEGDGDEQNVRGATRGSLAKPTVQALLQGLETAGRAHAATRGLLLQ